MNADRLRVVCSWCARTIGARPGPDERTGYAAPHKDTYFVRCPGSGKLSYRVGHVPPDGLDGWRRDD